MWTLNHERVEGGGGEGGWGGGMREGGWLEERVEGGFIRELSQ
jgi:hypothetical protein